MPLTLPSHAVEFELTDELAAYIILPYSHLPNGEVEIELSMASVIDLKNTVGGVEQFNTPIPAMEAAVLKRWRASLGRWGHLAIYESIYRQIRKDNESRLIASRAGEYA